MHCDLEPITKKQYIKNLEQDNRDLRAQLAQVTKERDEARSENTKLHTMLVEFETDHGNLESAFESERKAHESAKKERDQWHSVAKQCEQIFGCDDTAEGGLMSNLPNLVRDLLHQKASWKAMAEIAQDVINDRATLAESKLLEERRAHEATKAELAALKARIELAPVRYVSGVKVKLVVEE